MAADGVRGDGLFQAHRALAALADDPDQLDQARERRFSGSPPSYRSRSGTTTRTESPVDEDDPLVKYIERRDELFRHWVASCATRQFHAQRSDEIRRIERAREHVPVGSSEVDVASDNIRQRWIEQGIWDPRWYKRNLELHGEMVVNEPFGGAQWMHESPLEDDSESPEESPLVFTLGKKRKRQRTDEEARKSAERRAERRRRRELSRPIHQFNYHVSRELERLLEEREASDDDAVKRDPLDISTQAYTLVKDKWVRWMIWVDSWGVLPGMTWLHERDFDELALEMLGPMPPPRAKAAVSSEVAVARRHRAEFREFFESREALAEDCGEGSNFKPCTGADML